MKRIIIKCSHEDSKEILEILENNCPFSSNYPEYCGEDARCSECIDRHVEFEIIKSETIEECPCMKEPSYNCGMKCSRCGREL